MKHKDEAPRYWILEWSFKGKNVWQPVDRTFRSELEVLSYHKRNGFDYRTLELVAAPAVASSPDRAEALCVSEVRPEDPPPSCHVCGTMMVPKEFKCLSCGATTGASDPASPDRAEELAREIVDLKAFAVELGHYDSADCYESDGQDNRDPDKCNRCYLEQIIYNIEAALLRLAATPPSLALLPLQQRPTIWPEAQKFAEDLRNYNFEPSLEVDKDQQKERTPGAPAGTAREWREAHGGKESWAYWNDDRTEHYAAEKGETRRGHENG